MKALRIGLAIEIIQWTLTAVVQLVLTLFIKIKRDCKHDRKESEDLGWKISSTPASGSASENRSKKTWFKLCVHFLNSTLKQTETQGALPVHTGEEQKVSLQVVNVKQVWTPPVGTKAPRQAQALGVGVASINTTTDLTLRHSDAKSIFPTHNSDEVILLRGLLFLAWE